MKGFKELIEDEIPVLVDFSAEWCGPCKMLAPELGKLKKMHGDSFKIIKIDIDKNPRVAESFNISGVPTLLLFRKGKILWRQSGAATAQQLSGIIMSKISVN